MTALSAIGLYTAVLAMSPVIAVVAGGPIIERIGWRWLFVFQAVPATVAIIVGYVILPDTPRKTGTRFDVLGAMTLAGGITTTLLAINRGNPWGWTHPIVVGGFIIGPLLLALFVRIENHTDSPLVPMGMLRRREFSLPVVTNGLVQLSYMGGFTIAPFMLSRLFGYKTYKTALIIAIRPIAFSIAAWIAGRQGRRFDVRVFQISGNAVVAFSSVRHRVRSLAPIAAAAHGRARAGGRGGGLRATVERGVGHQFRARVRCRHRHRSAQHGLDDRLRGRRDGDARDRGRSLRRCTVRPRVAGRRRGGCAVGAHGRDRVVKTRPLTTPARSPPRSLRAPRGSKMTV